MVSVPSMKLLTMLYCSGEMAPLPRRYAMLTMILMRAAGTENPVGDIVCGVGMLATMLTWNELALSEYDKEVCTGCWM